MNDLPGYELIPEGLLYRVIRKSELPGYQKKISAGYWEEIQISQFHRSRHIKGIYCQLDFPGIPHHACPKLLRRKQKPGSLPEIGQS